MISLVDLRDVIGHFWKLRRAKQLNRGLLRLEGRRENEVEVCNIEQRSVALRVVTGDDELVRTITVNNNRQNAMTAAALRSNDPVQIRLAGC